eukprot:Gb_09198 [translate_table: standard]
MSYWKGKVLPKIKKYFGKGFKKRAVEAAKSFDKSKESIENEIQEKKDELHPQVVKIYNDSKPESKMVLKEPTEERIKQQAEASQDLLQRLADAGFPGAQILKDAGEKYGVASMSVQILFLLQKISPFVANEESPVVIAKGSDAVEHQNDTADTTGAPKADDSSAADKDVKEATMKVNTVENNNSDSIVEPENETTHGESSQEEKVQAAAST